MTQTQQTRTLRISADEAFELVQSGRAVVLDVVDTEDYANGTFTVAGAIRIAPERIRNEYGTLPRGKTILTYCT